MEKQAHTWKDGPNLDRRSQPRLKASDVDLDYVEHVEKDEYVAT